MKRLHKAILSIILAILLLYPFLPKQEDSGAEAGSGDLLEDIQLAVLHYNQSTRLLAEGKSPGSGAAGEALDVASRLEDLSLLGGGGGLLGLMSEAFKSYAHMAWAAAAVYNASTIHSSITGNITRVLLLLNECRVEEAVAEWSQIEGQVDVILATTRVALSNATQVDLASLLSDEHKEVYMKGLAAVQGLYNDLTLLKAIMKAVQDDPDAQSKCIQGNMSLGVSIDTTGLGGSPYSYELYTLLQKLQESSQEAGVNNGMGSGAGGGQPPSDD
ncbi:MAG: hypothetical protein GSR84_07355 [Desulfurococcales archaeon]|nr:hypothetical protein [Desulfurococcales archaeon]